MDKFHYTACGLSNVYIQGLPIVVDDDGDDVIEIPRINELHRYIALGIVSHKRGMSGEELRFLRTEIGYTQSELSKLVHKDKQTVGRWERAETSIDPASETIIRKLAIEQLSLSVTEGIDELARRSVPSARPQEITIKASDGDYSLEVA